MVSCLLLVDVCLGDSVVEGATSCLFSASSAPARVRLDKIQKQIKAPPRGPAIRRMAVTVFLNCRQWSFLRCFCRDPWGCLSFLDGNRRVVCLYGEHQALGWSLGRPSRTEMGVKDECKFIEQCLAGGQLEPGLSRPAETLPRVGRLDWEGHMVDQTI